MSELVTQVADAVGIDNEVAAQAIGFMLSFLRKEGDDNAVEKMIAAIPGASELADNAASTGGGLLGGLLGGGIMGLGQKLMSLGRAWAKSPRSPSRPWPWRANMPATKSSTR